ncbi:glycoside hydrolase family 75 protein [Streptomyces sp. CAU 1734]|uniref:glycoside hydrolase family 75 protein n=1 Tax=Streptomyces sp. CAU 1734 TaxID=3140360 RepID=UPI003261BE37
MVRTRTLVIAAVSGAALLSAAALPAKANTVPRVVVPPPPPPPLSRPQIPSAVLGAADPSPPAGRAETAAPPDPRKAAGVRKKPADTAEEPAAPVSAAELLAEVTECRQISRGRYRRDMHRKADVPVCGKNGAVFWKADLDIDCDGRPGIRCNAATDPYFGSSTAYTQSDGRPLKAEKLPFIVVPSPSRIWRYPESGIRGGGVVAVVHGGRVRYGVVGDTGPAGVIGEASYAMAESLGIDPDPRTGGAASGVTYILFRDSRVRPIESHATAVALGERLARKFLREN